MGTFGSAHMGTGTSSRRVAPSSLFALNIGCPTPAHQASSTDWLWTHKPADRLILSACPCPQTKLYKGDATPSLALPAACSHTSKLADQWSLKRCSPDTTGVSHSRGLQRAGSGTKMWRLRRRIWRRNCPRVAACHCQHHNSRNCSKA